MVTYQIDLLEEHVRTMTQQTMLARPVQSPHSSAKRMAAAACVAAAMTCAACSKPPANQAANTATPNTATPTTAAPNTATPNTATAGAAASYTSAAVGAPEKKPWKEGDPVPKFTGPWRDRFLLYYKESTTDEQRKVLNDGKVTEQEYAQLHDAFGECLKPHGFTEFSYKTDGTMEYRPPQGMADKEIDRIHDRCQETTVGTIDMLFTGMRMNPQNEDITELMAACFVRLGLTPKGYSGADYVRDSPDGYPFDSNDSRFGQCVHDPKGILGE